jgi:hypothetical protein
MAITHTKISSTIVGTSAVPNITFSSIPATYTDLKLVCSTRTDIAVQWLTLLVNGATTNISGRYIVGDGSAASSSTISAGGLLTPSVAGTFTANAFSSNEFYFPNYTGSTNKSISVDGAQEYNSTAWYGMLSAVLWSSTSAITSVGIQAISGANLVQYTTATLYGIKNS